MPSNYNPDFNERAQSIIEAGQRSRLSEIDAEIMRQVEDVSFMHAGITGLELDLEISKIQHTLDELGKNEPFFVRVSRILADRPIKPKIILGSTMSDDDRMNVRESITYCTEKIRDLLHARQEILVKMDDQRRSEAELDLKMREINRAVGQISDKYGADIDTKAFDDNLLSDGLRAKAEFLAHELGLSSKKAKSMILDQIYGLSEADTIKVLNGTLAEMGSNISHTDWVQLVSHLCENFQIFAIQDENVRTAFAIAMLHVPRAVDVVTAKIDNFAIQSPVNSMRLLVALVEKEGGLSCVYRLTRLFETLDEESKMVFFKTYERKLDFNFANQLALNMRFESLEGKLLAVRCYLSPKDSNYSVYDMNRKLLGNINNFILEIADGNHELMIALLADLNIADCFKKLTRLDDEYKSDLVKHHVAAGRTESIIHLPDLKIHSSDTRKRLFEYAYGKQPGICMKFFDRFDIDNDEFCMEKLKAYLATGTVGPIAIQSFPVAKLTDYGERLEIAKQLSSVDPHSLARAIDSYNLSLEDTKNLALKAVETSSSATVPVLKIETLQIPKVQNELVNGILDTLEQGAEKQAISLTDIETVDLLLDVKTKSRLLKYLIENAQSQKSIELLMQPFFLRMNWSHEDYPLMHGATRALIDYAISGRNLWSVSYIVTRLGNFHKSAILPMDFKLKFYSDLSEGLFPGGNDVLGVGTMGLRSIKNLIEEGNALVRGPEFSNEDRPPIH